MAEASKKPEWDTPAARANYRVWQEGVVTVVKKRGKADWSSSTLADLLSFITRWRLWSPDVVRFLRTVLALSPRRVLLKLIGGFIESLQPLLHVYFHNELLRIAYAAVETRVVNRRRLALAVVGRIVSSVLSDTMQHLLRENDGILQLLFNSMVEEHIMQARARLDIATQAKPNVARVFRHVGRMSSTSSWGGLIRDSIDGINSLAAVIVQVGVLRALTRGNRERKTYLALSSLGFLGTLRWILRSPNRERREETNADLQKMRLMFEGSDETTTRQESKMLHLDEFFLARYKMHAEALGPVSIDMDGPRSRISRLSELFENAVDAALFARYALKVKDYAQGDLNITVPDLQFIRAASRTLVTEVSSLFSLAYDFQHNVTTIREFYELLSIPPAIAEPIRPIPFPSTPGKGAAIELRNVSFHYPNKPPAVKNVSFKIKPGQVIALVGDNAAGKSTLIRILTRLVDPSSGEVIINDHNVKLYDSHELHKHMSVLFQSTTSLNLTIREFIGVGSVDKMDDQEAIEQAAREAGIHEAIMKLPLGYDSILGPYPFPPSPETFFRTCLREDWEEANVKYRTAMEREQEEGQRKESRRALRAAGLAEVGVSAADEKAATEDEQEDDIAEKEALLEAPVDIVAEGFGDDDSEEGDDSYEAPYPPVSFSGGEFQRLATARALLRSADGLKIFDEFSAALDPLAEREVFRQIWKTRQNSTILYVTHRFASVPWADKILCMSKGELVEEGTHEELLAAGGHYSEMYAAASASFTDGGEGYLDGEARSAAEGADVENTSGGARTAEQV